jgi:hypothetical protein
MKPYADTNFFTRYFLETAEPGAVTSLVESIGRRGVLALPVSWLHRIEVLELEGLETIRSILGA